MTPLISCAVIGEGNLLICCLKDLVDNNVDIKVVFSNTECANSLCCDNAIPFYKRNADLVAILRRNEIDYLFSISNPRILKEDVLCLPKKLTINYHDSPLPAYAGVHATSWAIINGEKSHGITWHVVETGIDTGDILKAESVDILEEDSAFTLNLKCVEAAKRTFKSLLGDILQNNVRKERQNAKDRSYFGLHAIPQNIGVLQFTKDITGIYNLARGLELGNHDNALGSPKVKSASGEFFVVTSVMTCNTIDSVSEPGRIIASVDDTVLVATHDNPIQLSLSHLDGSPIQKGSFREHSLTVGTKLDSSFQINTDKLIPIRKRESFWRRRMARYEPTMFYRQKMNVVAGIIDVSNEMNIKTVEILLPDLTVGKCTLSIAKNMQACFVAFLARINCSQDVHVGLLADKRDMPENCRDLYSNVTPGVFSVDQTKDVTCAIEICLEEIKVYKDAYTFLVDMFYRYPELRGMKRSPHHNIVIGNSTSILLTGDSVIHSVLHDCNVLLLFSDDSKATIMYNERPAQDFSHVIDILQHFSTFLNAINKSKYSMQLKYISMVSENELNIFYQRPDSFAMIESRYPTVSELVETQCRLTPLSIALKTTKHFITYTKLMEEINTLSSSLNETFGTYINPKSTFAIHLPNSVAYVVTVLGVLKSNHAFLPLPMNLPADRLVFTLKDASISQLILLQKDYHNLDMNGLTQYMNVLLKHQIADQEVIVVDFGKDQANNQANGYPAIALDESERLCEDFAYIMYTSGSTGRPKGVKVKESSVINLARSQITEWDLGPGEVIAQFASIGFDASISEILTSILSGGTLAILGLDERLGSNFVAAMNKMKVSVITLPPSALNIYSHADIPTLRKVISAGEACTLNISIKWASTGKVRFFNAYGPTEGTVCATCYEYLPGTIYEDVNRDLPIGKAIDGVNVYLFDDFMNPVPPDVVGEIYIGGKGLAHGYIGHASHVTKQKFVQSPLVKERSLLYRTGDHGFLDKDGNLTYIGRMDDQVKIRGHRIDLSEIEQVLIQHPKLEMAVVVVHKCNQTKEMSIAAFVAPTFIYISELREYLAKVLPNYMVPTYIKKLEVADLPKSINGKVNRKQLEQDESIHEIVKVDGHSHLNETQLLIAKYWCTVFKFEESFVYSLHRRSSFSEFGGNSLQLVLIMRMIEDELKIPISFTDIGTADTLEEFAEVIKRSQDIKKKSTHCDLKSKEELRELIFQDSELTSDFFPHPDRRRSVQFTHYTTQVHRTSSRKHPKNILISGVTGFLGAFLLSEILEQSHAHVCCMVRETTEARGIGRIMDNMRKYGLWKFEYSSRVAVVISDLSQKNMGIAPDIYKSLCNAIDVVFMNAAMMNFNTPYDDHRIANVEGTKEFIKFATTGVQKYIFTTSSLSVFLFPPSTEENTSCRRILGESDFFNDPLLIEGGYGQSKWASERLVMQALDFLPGGAIFRPARISGRSTDGVAPKNDLFASTMIGMNKMGSYPDMDFPYDLTPVDYCARAMVEISIRICEGESDSFERVYHLFNPNTIPFNELFSGMNLKPLPLETWRSELKSLNENVRELISLTPFFTSEFWDKAPVWPIFETVNTDMSTSDSTKELMKTTSELLPVYKMFFGLTIAK